MRGRPCPGPARELRVPTRFPRPVPPVSRRRGGPVEGRVQPCGCLGRQPPRPGRRRRSPAPARLRDSPRGRTHHSNPCQLAHKPAAQLSCARGCVRVDRPLGSDSRAAPRPELPHLPPRETPRGRPGWPPAPLQQLQPARARASPARTPRSIFFPH